MKIQQRGMRINLIQTQPLDESLVTWWMLNEINPTICYYELICVGPSVH